MSSAYLISMPGWTEWLLIFIVLAILLVYFVFWIKTLFEIASSKYKHQATKVIWFLVVFFLNFPGLLAYYIFGRLSKIQLT